MEPQAPEVRVNITRDCVGRVLEMATQGFCGCLAVALIVIARRREAERFGFATEFGEKKGLALTQKNEFLYASPVVSRELVAEFPVEALLC